MTLLRGDGQQRRPGHRDFCGHCGTLLFTHNQKNAGFTSIRFPTLDDAAGFRPQLDLWTASAPAWVCLDDAIPHFPQSPVPPGS